MATPPPNLPTSPFDGARSNAFAPTPRVPGGGTDAPDPFGGNSASGLPRNAAAPASVLPRPVPVPVAPAASPAPESTPLAPPAFRQPRPAARGRRTVVLILSSVIVLSLLGVVGVIAARLLFSGGGTEPTPTPEPQESQLIGAPPVATETPSSTPGTPPAGDATTQVGDEDGDGLTNAEEAFYRTDPAKADTDGDTFTDSQEVRAGYDPLGPGKLDSDNDGFPDPDEREFGSDPFNPDTDGDGYSDGQEIKAGYNPLIPSPNDKL